MFKDELSQALYWLNIDKKGIADVTDPDVKKYLDSLTLEEARIAKRKFRKLWRKAAKSKQPPATISKLTETHNGKPTRRARVLRNAFVTRLIVTEVIKKASEVTNKRR